MKEKENRKIILFPFGQGGMLIKQILKECYGREADLIISDRYAPFNPEMKSLSYLQEIDCSEYVLLLTVLNPEKMYTYEQAKAYFPEKDIYTVIQHIAAYTKYGKYSYGPLCNHSLVESVGAFCSFAKGCTVVPNHALGYISTHPFIYYDKKNDVCLPGYDFRKPWYIEGIQPRGKVRNLRKIHIGNDVWFGQNVIVTNGSDIGNGVIAGAGAVITKPVPDYAVVVGVPARIVRYRYTQKQIEALNAIKWWDWPDEKIRSCYSDFFEDIDVFIQKHLHDGIDQQ